MQAKISIELMFQTKWLLVSSHVTWSMFLLLLIYVDIVLRSFLRRLSPDMKKWDECRSVSSEFHMSQNLWYNNERTETYHTILKGTLNTSLEACESINFADTKKSST